MAIYTRNIGVSARKSAKIKLSRRPMKAAGVLMTRESTRGGSRRYSSQIEIMPSEINIVSFDYLISELPARASP